MPETNYAVQFTSAGPYRRGDVISAAALAGLGPAAASWLSQGVVEPTTAPVTAGPGAIPPEAVGRVAALEAVVAERDATVAHLTEACEAHQAAAETAAAKAAGLEAQVAERAAECARLGARVAELEKAKAPPAKK